MRTNTFSTWAFLGAAALVVSGCTNAPKTSNRSAAKETAAAEAASASVASPPSSQDAPTLQQTVRSIYKDVLQREPSDAEIAAWEEQIKQGMSWLDAAKAFLAAPEHRKVVVTNYYRKFLHRMPDPVAQKRWTNHPELLAGRPLVVLAGILATPEYYSKKGANDPAFVWALHRDMLNREPVQGDVAGWLALTNSDRELTASGILGSDEYLNRLINEWHSKLLRRSPDVQGRANMLAALHANTSQWDLVAAILASQEYAALHACTPKTCVSQGKQCGAVSDGCGGTVQCGECAEMHECNAQNICEVKCEPLSCAEMLNDCGSVSDGCGHTIQCGQCPSGKQCGAGGVPNVCGSGTCEAYTCDRMGYTCGRFSDNCGGVLDCGTCAEAPAAPALARTERAH